MIMKPINCLLQVEYPVNREHAMPNAETIPVKLSPTWDLSYRTLSTLSNSPFRCKRVQTPAELLLCVPGIERWRRRGDA